MVKFVFTGKPLFTPKETKPALPVLKKVLPA
jgi:hypothetical protein